MAIKGGKGYDGIIILRPYDNNEARVVNLASWNGHGGWQRINVGGMGTIVGSDVERPMILTTGRQQVQWHTAIGLTTAFNNIT